MAGGYYTNNATPASNTSIGGIGSAVTSDAGNADDLFRELAAQGRQFANDLAGLNTVGGTGDAIILTLASGTVTAYADGQLFAFIAPGTNTITNPTLNAHSIGAKTLKKFTTAEAALAASDIRSGGLYLARYRSAWASAAGAFQLLDMNHTSVAALVAADIGVTVQGYDANTIKANATKTLTAGYATTPYNAGTKTTGTFTPSEANGHFQYASNAGAHTLAPPSNNCSISIEYTNASGAGAVTTSGFTKVSGSFTTTVGHKFMVLINKTNASSLLQIVALQ